MERCQSSCLALVQASLLAALATGCADAYYRQFTVGQAPRDYDRILPQETSLKTDLGLCHVSRDAFGRTDALVILLTPDRRVAARFHAIDVKRTMGGTPMVRGYRLEGEIDPRLCGIESVGPLDGLRSLLTEIGGYEGVKLALDAHAWVGGGLAWMIRSWPGVSDLGISAARLDELLGRVPGGGSASLGADAQGIWNVRYEFGVVR
ncbi:MAG: hypothetical protein HRF50_05685 [Phycisphaerae bacterium]|jgi:hypothetical protein